MALGGAGDSFAKWNQQDPDKLFKSLCGSLLIRYYGHFPCLDPSAFGRVSEGDALKVFPECSAKLTGCPEEQVP